MKASTIEKLIWVVLYGGLLVVGLGLSVRSSDGPLGTGIAIGGGLVAAFGLVLIYVRSRMKGPT